MGNLQPHRVAVSVKRGCLHLPLLLKGRFYNVCGGNHSGPHCRSWLCGVKSVVQSLLAGLPVTRGSSGKTTKTGFMFCVRDDLDYAKEFLYRH